MAQSRLSAEEFDQLDAAAWNAVGGKCTCEPGAPPCKRAIDQMDILAWAMVHQFDNGDVMIEEWKKNRKLRIEYPYLFAAKWPEGKP